MKMNKNLSLKPFVRFTLIAIAIVATAPSLSFAQSDVSAPNVVAPAQPAAAAATTTGTATTAAAPQQPSMFGMAMPFLVMLGIMYFLMIRPQQKRMKQQQEMLRGLQNGDEVVTSSGILGTITGMSDKVVTLEISKNVQMKVLKSQVNQVVKGTIPEIQA